MTHARRLDPSVIVPPAASVLLVAAAWALCPVLARAAEAPLADATALQTQSRSLALPAVEATPGAVPAATLEWDARRQAAAHSNQREDRQTEESWRVRYVRWAGVGGALGVSVGVGAERISGRAAPLTATAPAEATRLGPEVGVRLRTPWTQDRRVDVDAWRSYAPPGPGAGLGRGANNARVELQFRDPGDDDRLSIPRGAFGIQTSANSQWVLRAKRGGPMVYYRARW